MVFTHSIDLFCTETEDSLPVPDSPRSTVSSLTETEIWTRDAEEISALTDNLDETSVNEVEWKGRSDPAPQPFVAYADDKIEVEHNTLCKVTYRCCLCDESHLYTWQRTDNFDPTSVTFKLGQPPVRSIVAACTLLDKPKEINLSFHRWQMRGVHTVLTSPPMMDGAAASITEAGGGAAAAVMSTPQSRKRHAEDAPGAPRRARASSFVSLSTDDVRERLSARF